MAAEKTGHLRWVGIRPHSLAQPSSSQLHARSRPLRCRSESARSISTIEAIDTRFSDKLVEPKQGEFGEGTSVELENGVYGISYDNVPAVGRSRMGDKVRTCLSSVPMGCPKGDNRGKFYTTTNLRTQESWTLPESQHMCGGA